MILNSYLYYRAAKLNSEKKKMNALNSLIPQTSIYEVNKILSEMEEIETKNIKLKKKKDKKQESVINETDYVTLEGGDNLEETKVVKIDEVKDPEVGSEDDKVKEDVKEEVSETPIEEDINVDEEISDPEVKEEDINLEEEVQAPEGEVSENKDDIEEVRNPEDIEVIDQDDVEEVRTPETVDVKDESNSDNEIVNINSDGEDEIIKLNNNGGGDKKDIKVVTVTSFF